MKRLSLFLAVCLMCLMYIPAAAADMFHYENQSFGFSITIPSLSAEEITVEEYETGVSFFHTPSKERWGGLIGSIEIVSPRSKISSAEYANGAYRILAMGKDKAFLWKSATGGVNSGGEMLEPYIKVSSMLSFDSLQEHLVIANPDIQPLLSTERHHPYLVAKSSKIRPNDPLSRGELAEMVYALLEASNKGKIKNNPFPDVTGKSYEQAVAYLASYGIFSGYSDGTFRPERPVSRAEFSVLLHRCQFIPAVGSYGDAPDFADVPSTHWAAEYIYSARVLGWMQGYSDGTFRPNNGITRAEAVTVIHRMLGRDESYTYVEEGVNPFLDLASDHWAYRNILEATGVLSSDYEDAVGFEGVVLPQETSASSFLNESVGWAVSKAQLYKTSNGGKTWDALGSPFSFAVSGIFFFNDQDGILLGSNEECPCILMQTADGGKTWSNRLAYSTTQALLFANDQFPDEKSMLDAITAAELRPASQDAIYLTIWYRPYDSIYPLNFEAVKQITLTAQAIKPSP